MFRFVRLDEPEMSNQLLGFPTFNEFDCAHQPRCVAGQFNDRFPPVTLKLMLVG